MNKRVENKVTLINIVTSLIMQICTIISGFILPRIALGYFGSEVNGLTSSISQFLNYITIMEGGITGVLSTMLYKPLCEKDDKKISSIIKTADNFYKKVGYIYFGYTLIVAVVYPLVVKTSFSFTYIFSLTLIISINLAVQYVFALSLKTLIESDKKIYIISITQTITTLLNLIISIIVLKIYPNVHLYKIIAALFYIAQPIVYMIFVKRNYKINKNVEIDKDLLKSRWEGFFINLAAFIHFGTDVTILTIFMDLKTVSVYSIYSMICSNIQAIIGTISKSINPVLGHAYASGNLENLNNKMDIYEFVIFFLIFTIYIIAMLLIVPFVMIYTNNVTDANYYQPVLGVLLLVSSMLYLVKFPHLSLSYVANKFKEVTLPSFIEALINIVLSVILVKIMGMIGVVIGTIVAMLYRMVFHVNYTKKLIYNRKQIIFYKKLLVCILASVVGILICVFCVPPVQYNIWNWIVHGIIYTIIIGVIMMLTSLIFFKNEVKFLTGYLKRGKKNKDDLTKNETTPIDN